MSPRRWTFSLGLLLTGSLAAFQPVKNQHNAIRTLRWVGEYDLPYNQAFHGTTIGGLSGIDYDSVNGLYYVISDDRSAINPARFYSLKLFFDESRIDSVQFLDVHQILQPDGHVYPGSKQDRNHVVDPEAIRYNPGTRQLIWTSEGERIIKSNDTLLQDPAINITDLKGTHIGAVPIPQNLLMTSTEKGPRQNGTLEGLTFSADFKDLFVSLEEPLYEDGPRADLKPGGSWVRIYQFDIASKKNIAQFAYPLDPVAQPASPENAFKINGITDLLYFTRSDLLVVERSFSTGHLHFTVKVFVADISKAGNILKQSSLAKNPPASAAAKKLLINMDDLGIYIDNIEGVTFGPRFKNGHRSLIFVSDNNFSIAEKTQFLLFEIIP